MLCYGQWPCSVQPVNLACASQVVLIEAGGNDFSNGTKPPSNWGAEYKRFLRQVQTPTLADAILYLSVLIPHNDRWGWMQTKSLMAGRISGASIPGDQCHEGVYPKSLQCKL